jgi:hypothetical protein
MISSNKSLQYITITSPVTLGTYPQAAVRIKMPSMVKLVSLVSVHLILGIKCKMLTAPANAGAYLVPTLNISGQIVERLHNAPSAAAAAEASMQDMANHLSLLASKLCSAISGAHPTNNMG